VNRDGQRAPTAIHGTLGLKFHPLEKANAIADCNIKINDEKTQAISSHQIRPTETTLTLSGRTLPFVNSVESLGIIFDKKITRRLNIETVTAKTYGTFIRLYSLFISERLSTRLKLTLHKAIITSVMTYACPAWEFAADTHVLKLQRLQTRFCAPTATLQGTFRFETCIMLFKLRT
jgi:hypothetical protein